MTSHRTVDLVLRVSLSRTGPALIGVEILEPADPLTGAQRVEALRRALRLAVAVAYRFTCPRCGRASSHPKDLEQGYCGACHTFTGGSVPGPVGHDNDDA